MIQSAVGSLAVLRQLQLRAEDCHPRESKETIVGKTLTGN